MSIYKESSMGYRSQIIIAVAKNVYDTHLALGTVPECLISAEPESVKNVTEDETDAVYWHLDQWKWYDSYPDVKTITDWFEVLDNEEELASLIRPKTPGLYPTNRDTMYKDARPPYGMVRTGEDKDDMEEMGEPSYYDIAIDVSIISPLDYM